MQKITLKIERKGANISKKAIFSLLFHELLITLQSNLLNMKKRLYIIILLMVAFVLPSNAVLKEANLDTTLYMLRTELTNYHIDLEKQNQAAKAQQLAVIQELISIVKQADQNSIMLYSQRNGYIFDMTYACHEATEQFKKFKSKAVPFRQMIKKNNVEVARFDSLINYLYGMNTMFLSEEAQVNRNVDLTLAVNIRRQLVEKQKQLQAYVQAYDRTDRKLQALNDYANRRYEDIQNSIFNNGGDNYLRILRNISMNYKEAKTSVTEKYKPVPGMMSQWDVRIIFILFGIIVFWGLISIFLNLFTIRIVITQLMKHGMFENRKESFMAKRPCLIMAMTVVTFAVILGIVRMAVTQNFVIMASQLLVEYSWLVGVILVSILLRVDNDKIKNTFRIYSPLMLVGFIVIVFRIILIPNDLVNLIFPPVLLLCALWQWNVIGRKHNQVLRTDKTYAFISLAVFGVSTILPGQVSHCLPSSLSSGGPCSLPACLPSPAAKDGSAYMPSVKAGRQGDYRQMAVSLHLQGITPYFRRTLVHHLYLLGCRCIQHERYYLGDIQQGLHQDQQLHCIAFQYFRGSLSVLPVQLHQHYFCRFHASSLRESRPGVGCFKDCDVQERDAGDYLGYLADDSPERIPGW